MQNVLDTTARKEEKGQRVLHDIRHDEGKRERATPSTKRKRANLVPRIDTHSVSLKSHICVHHSIGHVTDAQTRNKDKKKIRFSDS